MFRPDEFSHFLSYGATDQQTVRELVGRYDGLLVPGTVAAFQREGTGGFVLSLSASSDEVQYVIDPRFPLFQQRLISPKRSHQSLADLVGAPDLVQTQNPEPSDFTPALIETIGREWALFNGGYRASAGSKFAKYAKRLGRAVMPTDAKVPLLILAPYFMASGRADPWWRVSNDLFGATSHHVDGGRCIRVVAATDVLALLDLLASIDDDRIAIWVSGLDELSSPAQSLSAYASAIQQSSSRGMHSFALYGGFFSVLLSSVGLAGSSHGIGYGEYRRWIELPESGPPPSRYYVPRLHRYIQTDEAARLYMADPRLAECACAECDGAPPIALDYHALMKHSVHCRAEEISGWRGLPPLAMADRLMKEAEEYSALLHGSDLPEIGVMRAERQSAHLLVWANALRMVGSQ